MWAINSPVASLPLLLTMLYLQRRATKSDQWKSGVAILRDVNGTDSFWRMIYQVLWV